MGVGFDPEPTGCGVLKLGFEEEKAVHMMDAIMKAGWPTYKCPAAKASAGFRPKQKSICRICYRDVITQTCMASSETPG